MSTSQKEGVFGAVVAFMEENGRHYEKGMKVELNTADRKTVITMLIAATQVGELEVKSPAARMDLNKYWNGTLSNWLRRDSRLNGGVEKVEPKNPGSRQGVGDAELKELKKLLAQVTLTGIAEHIGAVQKAIDERSKVIAAEQAKKLAIDLSKLDPKLLASLGLVKATDPGDEQPEEEDLNEEDFEQDEYTKATREGLGLEE